MIATLIILGLYFAGIIILATVHIITNEKKEPKSFKNLDIIPDAAEMASLAASSSQEQNTKCLERIVDRIKIAAHNGNRCVFISDRTIRLDFDRDCKKYLKAKGYKVKKYYGESPFEIYLEVKW